METHFPIKHRILQNGKVQIHSDENEVSIWKNTITSLVLGKD